MCLPGPSFHGTQTEICSTRFIIPSASSHVPIFTSRQQIDAKRFFFFYLKGHCISHNVRARYEAALQLIAAAFLGQWSPVVPGPVTTLEALLGPITEHLLQLLGAWWGGGGGEKKGPGRRTRRGVCVWGGVLQRNGSCMVSGKGAGPRVHACMRGPQGAVGGGPWSDGTR